jgi:mono/diheme cytochrome c family protein
MSGGAFVTLFLLKSLLSLPLLVLAIYGMVTMFEVLDRGTAPVRTDRLRKRHKVSGYIFILLFLLITYLCIGFTAASRTELSPRAALHVLLALSIIALFLVKVLFVRIYRQFYGQARTIGVILGIMSVVLIGLSAGYYLTVSRFGTDRSLDKSASYVLRGPFLAVKQTGTPGVAAIRTDRLSIERGRSLFASRCSACHDPLSTRTIVGPGFRGLLRNPLLPISKNPATAESIRFQLRQPRGAMPSFAYLSEDEISDLLAYLNTL